MMINDASFHACPSLLRMIEDRIRLTTGNRVRGLMIDEVGGRVRIRGQAPTRQTKQQALMAVLEFLSGDELQEQIVVS